ncbi:hypothetical protein ACFWPX_25335 [Nocardia sp. NPDC058518]|uniref:hypothetical protein n=1 Tax=Nocardia sp. NPDC058518 TaxID=3346534 RepID=UPI0036672FB2
MTTDLHFHSTASRRATLLYVLARVILKPFYRIWPLNDHGLRALRLIDTTLGLLPYAKTVSLERFAMPTTPTAHCSVSRPTRTR